MTISDNHLIQYSSLPEKVKIAFSKSLGHNSYTTTCNSYSNYNQKELIEAVRNHDFSDTIQRNNNEPLFDFSKTTTGVKLSKAIKLSDLDFESMARLLPVFLRRIYCDP